MRNLTKRDKALLTDVLSSMKTAEKFIKRDDVFICKDYGRLADPNKFTNAEGVSISEVNKHIGSEICYLYKAIRTLENLLNPQTEENDENII